MNELRELSKVIKIGKVLRDIVDPLGKSDYTSIEHSVRSYQVKVSYADLDLYEDRKITGYLTSTGNKPYIVLNGNRSESERKFALLELFVYAFMIGYNKNEVFKELSKKEVVYAEDTPLMATWIASEVLLPYSDFNKIKDKLELLYSELPDKMLDFLIKENIKKAYGIPEKAYSLYLNIHF